MHIACYYFPNYHADARNARKHGAGWNEWALMRAARPRFPGHAQPKVPLWGYEDEADPAVFARKIDDDLLGMATGEAIAHMNCLIGRGQARAVRDEEGVIRYETV